MPNWAILRLRQMDESLDVQIRHGCRIGLCVELDELVLKWLTYTIAD